MDSLIELDQRVAKNMHAFEENLPLRNLMHDSLVNLTRHNMIALRAMFSEH